MSYILQALKKAERDRNRGRVPSLHDPTAPTVESLEPSRSRVPRTMALFLLVAALAVVHVYVRHKVSEKLDQGNDSSAAAAPQKVQQTPATEVPPPTLEPDVVGALRGTGQRSPVHVLPGFSLPPETIGSAQISGGGAVAPAVVLAETLAPEIAADTFDDLLDIGPAFATAQERPAGSGVSNQEKSVADAAPIVTRGEPQSTEPVTGRDSSTGSSDSSPVTGTQESVGLPPPLKDMPAEFRSKFPGIRIDVHVYDPDPDKRWVMINGEKATEGMRITGGAMLDEIRAQGIIVSLDGSDVLLTVN